MRISTALSGAAALGTLFVLFVPTWSRPVPGTQMGFRASSMIQWAVSDPYAIDKNALPPPTPAGAYGVDPAALADTRPATAVYKNVQITKDISAGDFMKLQVALTTWVAPKEGCAFCHAGPNVAPGSPEQTASVTGSVIPATTGPVLDWASDDKPQKNVARIMLTMTRNLNTEWSSHVAPSGVTCYTCHRGQNVPALAFYPKQSSPPEGLVAKQENWHESASTVHDFFPDASQEEYLLNNGPSKGQSYTTLRGQSEGPSAFPIVIRIYEVMMTMSDDIGVNCGYCHNSRALFDWGQSTPQRWNGLSGIHMTQAINQRVMLPLHDSFPQIMDRVHEGQPPTIPARETGPLPGNAFANCGTCHYGNPKPLNGVNLVHDYPALIGTQTAAAEIPAAAAPTPAPVPAPTPAATPAPAPPPPPAASPAPEPVPAPASAPALAPPAPIPPAPEAPPQAPEMQSPPPQAELVAPEGANAPATTPNTPEPVTTPAPAPEAPPTPATPPAPTAEPEPKP